MKKLITLTILLLSGTVSFAQCSELFFSEYIEGSSSNKALEIYNPTSGPIDLSGYVVKRHTNGAATASGTYDFPVGTILAAGDVYVIANSSADPLVLAVADTTNAAAFFNGDDAITLENIVTGDTIDVIGEVGIDPGTNWTVGSGATSEFTLVRNIGIQQGTNDWTIGATEWTVLPQNTFDSLGMHTMTSCAPPVPMFGPCGDLFFSEYIEGSSSNKALEIYNPTSFDIDLSNYVIFRANNGSVTPNDSIFPVGTIVAGDVFVIGNPSANAAILAETDTTHTLTFFNGDDAIYMINLVSGDTLDIFGEIGIDPGAGWPVGSGATNNNTLIRNININQGELDWAIGSTQWTVFPIDAADSLGAHSMTPCGAPCSPITFNQTITSCSPVTSPSGTYVWTTTGIYNDTIVDPGGCDSLYVVDVTIGSETTSTIQATACNAYNSPSGQIYTASGMYMDTIPNALGCDSVITINLVIDPTSGGCANQCSELFFSEYIEGSSNNKALEIYNPTGGAIDLVDYVVKRHTNGAATASGTYDFPAGTFIAAGDVYVIGNSSADSVGILSVADTTNGATFFNGDDALILENIATGDTIDVIGQVGIDPGQNWPVGSGATSEFTLVRSAAIQQGNNDWATAASEWNVFPQNTFDSLGAHYMIACAVLPCNDSDTSFAVTACDSYTSPSGIIWNTSGSYIDIIPNAAGCDSVITINLTITTVDVSTTLSGETLTATASGATYQWIDCDNANAPITGETGQSFTATTTGNYAVIVTANNCTDTSACEAVMVNSLPEFGLNKQVVVHPNPTSGNVSIDFGSTIENVSVRVLDALGREIENKSFTSAQLVEMTINGEAGQYFIEVNVDGTRAAVKRVIKK